MTNQQGAPEALRTIRRFYRGNDCMAENQAGDWVRYEDHVAAMVKAQQPAPSAAAAVNPDPHAELRKTWKPGQRWQARSFRNGQWGPWTDAGAREPFWFPYQDYRRHPDDLAPSPSPTPQADSQPAPQGETNAQLDTDSNPPTPGQQRDVAGPVALGQPVGNGSDQAAGHTGAQGDKLLTVAERNIRSFLRSATFKSESDREAALNCVDVLWAAARAPADSVTAPAGGVGDAVDAIALARYKVVPAHESMFHRFAVVAGDGKQQLYLGREVECENMARKFAGAFLDGAFYQSNIAPTPPAQAADSVTAPRQEAVVAAVFDEQRGRPVLVEGAPILRHGQPLYTAPQPSPTPQSDSQPVPVLDREAVIRAAVAAMPHTNPMVADDLLGGFTMHTEADDVIAIFEAGRAARAQADSVTAPQQEAQEPCPTCAALARAVMCDQVSFDRKPDCYGIRQITDDEGIEEWEDIRTSPDVAREEATDMMATGRGEIYEVVPLWTTPQPSLTAKAADSVLEDAERYRWLRRWKGQEHEPPFTVRHEVDGTLWGGDLDAAIDAALTAQGGKT